MANEYTINKEDMVSVADKIREKSNTEAPLEFPNGFTDGVESVYSKGYDKGIDDMWEVFQSKGGKTEYSGAFEKWDAAFFKPKYRINASGCTNMFRHFNNASYTFNGGHVPNYDMEAALAELGVLLQLDGANGTNCFQSAVIDTLPAISLRYSQNADYFFYSAEIKTIKGFAFPRNGSTTNIFLGVTTLENLTITEEIRVNNLNFQYSKKLTHESLMSIINMLQDKSADTSGTVWTITLGATNLAKLTYEEQQIARDKGWNLK